MPVASQVGVQCPSKIRPTIFMHILQNEKNQHENAKHISNPISVYCVCVWDWIFLPCLLSLSLLFRKLWFWARSNYIHRAYSVHFSFAIYWRCCHCKWLSFSKIQTYFLSFPVIYGQHLHWSIPCYSTCVSVYVRLLNGALHSLVNGKQKKHERRRRRKQASQNVHFVD